MKWRTGIRREVRAAAAAALVVTLIAFTDRLQGGQVCRDVVVELANQHQNHYLDEAEVLQLVQQVSPDLQGKSFARIDFRSIEQKLEANPHIQDAQAYSDVKGHLVVHVALRRPIARIVREHAPDAYIAEDGSVMRVSDKYASRVLLISGPLTAKMVQTGNIKLVEGGGLILDLIHTLRSDDFWNAQIAQMDVSDNGRLTLFPQVTSQRIEFGTAENSAEKLKKLMVFYRQILPQRGWNRYERVNVEFDRQIIAE
jgi:cell division protein FtsQ